LKEDPPMPTVDLRAGLAGDRLVVEYVVRNDLDQIVYLRNQLSDWYGLTGDPSLDALKNPRAGVTTAIACVERGGPGEARILVGGTPLPPDGEVFAPREPLGTRIEPGRSARATLRLPLPLLEWNAYEPPRREPAEAERIEAIRLRLEYLPAPLALSAQAHLAIRGAFVTRGRAFAYLEASAPLPSPCTLLRRTDAFARIGDAG
jgi:hypothetical protein